MDKETLAHEKYLQKHQKVVEKITNKISSNINVSGLNNINKFKKINPKQRILYVSVNHWSLADFIISTNEFLKQKIEQPFIIGGTNLYLRGFTKSILGKSIFPDFIKAGMIPATRKKINFKQKRKLIEKINQILETQGDIKLYDFNGRNKTGLITHFESEILENIIKKITKKQNWNLVIENQNYDEIPEIETLEKTVKIKKQEPKGYKHKAFLTDVRSFYKHSKNGAEENEYNLTYKTPIPINTFKEGSKTIDNILELINTEQKKVIVTPTSLVANSLTRNKKYNSDNVSYDQIKKDLEEFFYNYKDLNQYTQFIQKRFENPTKWSEIIDRGIFCLNKGNKNRLVIKNKDHISISENKLAPGIITYYSNQIAHLIEEEIFTEFEMQEMKKTINKV